MHFRKAGIAIPVQASTQTLADLEALVMKVMPEQLIILGDLFHSDHNTEWQLFDEFLGRFNGLHCVLVEGNHDILDNKLYQDAGLDVHESMVFEQSILMVHDPLEANDTSYYQLGGHIHPGVRIVGRGRQSMRLPCYYFGLEYGILPAFGRFTGLHVLDPKKNDRVYTVVTDQVIKIQ